MESLEDTIQKVLKSLHSKGTPAEIHAAEKVSPDFLGEFETAAFLNVH